MKTHALILVMFVLAILVCVPDASANGGLFARARARQQANAHHQQQVVVRERVIVRQQAVQHYAPQQVRVQRVFVQQQAHCRGGNTGDGVLNSNAGCSQLYR